MSDQTLTHAAEAALPPATCSAYERLKPDEYLPHWYENEAEPEKLFVETNDGGFREFKMSPGRFVRDFAYPIYRLKPNAQAEGRGSCATTNTFNQ